MSAWAGFADGIAFTATLYVCIAYVVYRRRTALGRHLEALAGIGFLYLLIAACNLADGAGMTRKPLDAHESGLHILGALAFLLFFAAAERRELVSSLRATIAAQESTVLALGKAHERLWLLLSTLPDPVFVLTARGVVTFINTAFRRAFLPETVDERSYRAVPVEELPARVRSLVARCPYQEVVARNEAITRALRLAGTTRGGCVYHTHAFPLRGEEGAVKEVLYLVHDITPESQMLESALAGRSSGPPSTIMLDAVHELNNILTGIGGFAELMQGEAVAAEEAARFPAKVARLAAQASKLLSRLAEQCAPPGTAGADRSPLKALLGRLPVVLDRLLPPGIRVRVETASDLHSVLVDAPEMETALVNLVMNAAEASLPGGTVIVRAANVPTLPESVAKLLPATGVGTVCITVVDSGRGIHAEDRERIFAPFFTTKQARKGMGLPVALAIVERHRGTIRLERSDELGTVFGVYLPASGEVAGIAGGSDRGPSTAGTCTEESSGLDGQGPEPPG